MYCSDQELVSYKVSALNEFIPTVEGADLFLWLSPESLELDSSGQFVERWNDRSGRGSSFVKNSDVSRPLYMPKELGGHGVAKFNGITSSYKVLKNGNYSGLTPVNSPRNNAFHGFYVVRVGGVVTSHRINTF